MKGSFIGAKSWIEKLQTECDPHIVIALIANKTDLADKRAVGTMDGQEYADQNQLFFMETSARTDNNVNEIIPAITRRLPKELMIPSYDRGRNVKLHDKKKRKSFRCTLL